MPKQKRVFQLARELGIASRVITEWAAENGESEIANHMSVVSSDLQEIILSTFGEGPPSKRKRLLSIDVSGLFARADTHIGLKTDDRVTILHGPNGCGKTTILRLVADALEGRIERLFQMPCDILGLRFDDGTHVEIRKTNAKRTERPEHDFLPSEIDIALDVEVNGRNAGQVLAIPEEIRERLWHFPSHILRGVEQIGEDRWLDHRAGSELTTEEFLIRFRDRLPRSIRESLNEAGGPARQELAKALDGVEVFMIHTQRLVTETTRDEEVESRQRRREDIGNAPTVVSDADHLRREIRDRVRRYGEKAGQLDRTLPKRILGKGGKKVSDDKLRARYERVIDRRKQLVAAGVMTETREEEIELPKNELDQMTRRVLTTYLDDMESKLAVFDGFVERVDLFTEMINDLFEHKQVEVSMRHGFRFLTEEKQLLPPDRLSSGEQHQLVLLYNLLFRVPEHALILVDEPELSLHVTWQQQVIRNFMSISRLRDLDFLIATHSPEIVLVPLTGE